MNKVAERFNDMGITPREVFMNYLFDLSAKETSLNRDLEYITAKKFFSVIEDKFGLKFAKSQQDSLILIIGKKIFDKTIFEFEELL